ncbi:right-handed parallel beta-helix repeat-containing protein [Arcticibacterium luteifluviistationis]|uniref:Alpha-galactosidase n=1 Tax=Arcticibacterium luteifluviistationis TaxID=1784714 RepID=A0A2Z4GEN8_9BACT|nr:right-handed parallel beta-helix repeat-containing protein [Arcticibacterium luteifluviistationis]AWV99802.1 alpha-galactosidase [Arcticibacterium luteifluviistationis]
MKTQQFKFSFVAATLILLASFNLKAKDRIEIKHQKGDATMLVRNAIENAKGKNIQLFFEKGVYSFFPDYAKDQYCTITNHGNGNKKIIFQFDNFDSVEIDGNGSQFIFHGQVAPFQFIECGKVEVKNISIDWDIPFSFQGDVTAVNPQENWFEIKPYTDGYSWKLENERILFPNINDFHFASLGSTLTFDKASKQVDYGGLDMNLRPQKVEKQSNGILRIYQNDLRRYPVVGTVIHSKGDKEHNRYAPAFQTKNSNNILFQHITIHHALGMGFLFERSQDIKIIDCKIQIKESSDRAISIIADATHFANCKGDILIEDCTFEGMLDDGTNVHGTYVEVDKVLDKKTIRVKLVHFEQTGFEFAAKGDEVWFIKAPSPSRGETNTVFEVKRVNDVFTDLTFRGDLPEGLKVGDIVENKTWNPAFTMRGNTIRDHRARNIIIKTPKKIVIENNKLSSMMSSIMLRGESFFWYESGNVEDVLIRNNHFTDCAYGGAKGHAILTVSPRLGKAFDETELYDRNIVFENNTIETFGNRIVWADRLDGLIFRGNTIKQTKMYSPQFSDAPLFELINCKDVQIHDNSYEGDVTFHIKADERTKQTLSVKDNKGIKKD